jgi:hypothetical protein
MNSTSTDLSPSSKKSSPKSELEILEKKMLKCHSEINNYKQRMQTTRIEKWSQQMSSLLTDFYSDDAMDNHEHNERSIARSSFSDENKKRIEMLAKKLHSYEKRRQKLIERGEECITTKEEDDDTKLTAVDPAQGLARPSTLPIRNVSLVKVAKRGSSLVNIRRSADTNELPESSLNNTRLSSQILPLAIAVSNGSKSSDIYDSATDLVDTKCSNRMSNNKIMLDKQAVSVSNNIELVICEYSNLELINRLISQL